MNKLLAIDPGTHTTGLAVFEDGKLIHATQFSADPKLVKNRWSRQRDIALQIMTFLDVHTDIDYNREGGYAIVSEEPMMQGRSAYAMHKLLGAFEFLLSNEINYVYPASVKKAMGSGKLDKFEVALAAGALVVSPDEKELVASLIEDEKFDATDAIAIGLTYLKREQ